jgi:hypothetical protein
VKFPEDVPLQKVDQLFKESSKEGLHKESD